MVHFCQFTQLSDTSFEKYLSLINPKDKLKNLSDLPTLSELKVNNDSILDYADLINQLIPGLRNPKHPWTDALPDWKEQYLLAGFMTPVTATEKRVLASNQNQSSPTVGLFELQLSNQHYTFFSNKIC